MFASGAVKVLGATITASFPQVLSRVKAATDATGLRRRRLTGGDAQFTPLPGGCLGTADTTGARTVEDVSVGLRERVAVDAMACVARTVDCPGPSFDEASRLLTPPFGEEGPHLVQERDGLRPVGYFPVPYRLVGPFVGAANATDAEGILDALEHIGVRHSYREPTTTSLCHTATALSLENTAGPSESEHGVHEGNCTTGA
jgi:hypothetical protein